MKTIKQEKALKIIKMLAIISDPAASTGEIQNSRLLIEKLCRDYHLRIEGNKIIDTDIEFENKKKNMPHFPPIDEIVNPYKTNVYVEYRGKKYYKQPGQNAVPRSAYEKRFIK